MFHCVVICLSQSLNGILVDSLSCELFTNHFIRSSSCLRPFGTSISRQHPITGKAMNAMRRVTARGQHHGCLLLLLPFYHPTTNHHVRERQKCLRSRPKFCTSFKCGFRGARKFNTIGCSFVRSGGRVERALMICSRAKT